MSAHRRSVVSGIAVLSPPEDTKAPPPHLRLKQMRLRQPTFHKASKNVRATRAPVPLPRVHAALPAKPRSTLMTALLSEPQCAQGDLSAPPDLMRRLSDYATRKRVSQAVVVEAALESYLSPDGPDRLEAALARRLDRLSRASERLERHVTIGNEALALFVRFWLTSTPALPEAMQAASEAKGKERYDAFVEALGRRLAQPVRPRQHHAKAHRQRWPPHRKEWAARGRDWASR